KGGFNIALNREEIGSPIQLVVGPEEDASAAWSSTSSHTQTVGVESWKGEKGRYAFNPEIRIPEPIWVCWARIRVCVSGQIRKVINERRFRRYCPVPFVKVEVYDVDREWCWPWPWFLSVFEREPHLQVAQLPKLVAQLPPHIGPDPGPEFTLAS